MKIIFLIIFFLSLLSADNNKTKELEEWLKYNYTQSDISYIIQYIERLEKKSNMLEKRVSNIEDSLLEQNKIIKGFLLEQKNFKKKSLKKVLRKFKPSVFITKRVVVLYDNPNGKAIMKFKKDYKFTAYERSGNWIRVSGHFPQKRWRSMNQKVWVKEKFIEKIK